MLEQYVLKWIILFYVVCNLCCFVINPFSSICPCKKMITWLHRVPMPRPCPGDCAAGPWTAKSFKRSWRALENRSLWISIMSEETMDFPRHFLSRNRRVSPETIQDSRYSPMIFWGPKTCLSNLPRSGYVFNENSKGTCIDLADLAEYFVGLPIHGFDILFGEAFQKNTKFRFGNGWVGRLKLQFNLNKPEVPVGSRSGVTCHVCRFAGS